MAFEPGTRVGYSNTAYLLLSWIIEDVSGRTYRQYMEETVFRPLGLRNTGIFDPDALLPRRASHYRRPSLAPGIPVENESWANYGMFQGHGSLYSTAEDIAIFMNALRGGSFLAPASFAIMTTATPHDRNWGNGIERLTGYTPQAYGHGGAFNGARSDNIAVPEEDLNIVIISNNDSDTNAISRALYEIIKGQDVEMPTRHVRARLEPAVLSRYAGRYGRAELRMVDGKLMFDHVELIPESSTRFFSDIDHNLTYEFVVGPNGRPTAVISRRYGVARTINRVD